MPLVHPAREEPPEGASFTPQLDAGLPKNSPGNRYNPTKPQEVILRWARERLPKRVAERILKKPK